jgi:hypothetical protein
MAFSLPPRSAEPLRLDGSLAQPSSPPANTASLKVVVTARPEEAARRLERIRRGSGVEMTASLRREGQLLEEADDRPFPIDGPCEVTFSDLPRNERFRVAVKVPGLLIPHEIEVKTGEGARRVEVEIQFGKFRVEAQPGFGLYVSKGRGRLVPAGRASPHPDTYVARSGGGGDPARGGYFLEAGPGSVGFLFWPVPLFFVVLEPVDSAGTEPTSALPFNALETRPQAIDHEDQKRPFDTITLRTVEAPPPR